MIRQYYQIGGFEPHLTWNKFDDKGLAEAVAGKNSPLWPRGQDTIELILGIKYSGTSHLLLDENQLRSFVNAYRAPFPRTSLTTTDFVSLSPIFFRNVAELADKLGSLKIKVQKHRVQWDNSQANKQYLSGDNGVQRGEFEHGRMFYNILHQNVEPTKYSLPKTIPWANTVRICSFVFTPRSPDTRPSAVRRQTPLALDCAVAEATIPNIQYFTGSAAHFSYAKNTMLNFENLKKLPFKHGTSEELDDMIISQRLKDFFAHTGPTVLLVHGQEVSLNLLKDNGRGVDTSSWELGIKSLLGYPTEVKREPDAPARPGDPRRRPSDSYDPRRNQHNRRDDSYRRGSAYDERRSRPRSRSRSPFRPHEDTDDRKPYASGSRDYENSSQITPPHAYAPVYVVDLKEQYIKLMQTTDSSESVSKMADYLGIAPFDAGWCAGNEAVLMLDIWRLMISGLPIDDQHAKLDPKARAADARAARAKSTPAAPNLNGDGDVAVEYDSEEDPNSYAVGTSKDAVRHAPVVDDDDSDYGQSSNSDD